MRDVSVCHYAGKFQIYLHYIVLHVVYCSKTVIYSILDFVPEIHFFLKDFSWFPRLLKDLEMMQINEVFWSSEPAFMPLFYWLLNIRIKQIYPVSEGYLRKIPVSRTV